MSLSYLPPTDLQKLYRQVIEGPLAAALPQNLQTKWLRSIARDIGCLRKIYPSWSGIDAIEDLAGPSMYLAGPTMLILKLLSEFEGRVISKSEIGHYDMHKYMENYWHALVDEIISRATGVSFLSTTHKTIFSQKTQPQTFNRL